VERKPGAATVELTPATVEPAPATVKLTPATVELDPRIAALPDIHGHAKGEHKAFGEERPIPYTARMLFLWFFHACRRSSPRFLMVADHMNYLTFEDPAAVNLVRRALKLAQAGDLYGAAETAGVELGHAAVVSDGLRRGMRYSIGAEIDNDPRCRPDAQNIVDAMKPDGMIRSIHFLPIAHPQHGEHWMWAFDNPEFQDLYDVVGPANVWEIYMTTLLDAIEKLPGNIVGHFYVPAKFGHWPEDDVLEAYEDRFVAACAARSMAIEVNSRYFYKYYVGNEDQLARYRAAHLRLLRKAAAANVMIAVGSDAHSPKDQGRAFESVLALLDEAAINEIAFPIAGRLARVALRATEDILRQHSEALAPPVVDRMPSAVAPKIAEPAADAAIAVEASEANARPRAEAPLSEAANSSAVPAPKKRSHKKGTRAVAAVPAVAALADAVSAVASRAVEAVAGVLRPERSKAREATPAGRAPDEAKLDHVKPDVTTGDEPQSGLPHAKKPAAAKPRERVEPSPARRAPSARTVAPGRATTKPATARKGADNAGATKLEPKRGRATPAPAKAPATKKVAARKAGTKSARPAGRAAIIAKSSRAKAAPQKAATKKVIAKAPARKTVPKRPAAKSSPAVTKKAPAKRSTIAKKTAAKAAKRSAPTKAAAMKKSAAKKPAAKKSQRARR